MENTEKLAGKFLEILGEEKYFEVLLNIRRKKEEAWERFCNSGALFGASGCLTQVPNITEPIEQVKYLFDRFNGMEKHFMRIPWAYLKHCIDNGKIKKLPNEEWVTCLMIDSAWSIGGSQLVLQFLHKMK